MLSEEEKSRVFYDASINFEGQFDANYLIKLLFAHVNSDYVIEDKSVGSTKLHAAVISQKCTPSLVQDILTEDPSLLEEKNIFLVTPLHRAVRYSENIEVVVELLMQGSDVNAVERSAMSSLHIAACNSNQHQYALFDTLIKYGADVNCLDYRRQTPLHMLVKSGVVLEKSLCLLLAKGANPNAYDRERNSVLKIALHNQHMSKNILKILLKYGANPENELKNCLHRQSFAKLLLQYMAVMYISTAFSNINNGFIPRTVDFHSRIGFRGPIMEFINFFDQCFNELMVMRKIKIKVNYSLFDFISEQCFIAKSRNPDKNISLVEDVLLLLSVEQFPFCSDLIDASFELQDVLKILFALNVYTKVPFSENLSSERKITLNCYTIANVTTYLSKLDVINLTIAYMNKQGYKKLCDTYTHVSKLNKRSAESMCDSELSMKHLKLNL